MLSVVFLGSGRLAWFTLTKRSAEHPSSITEVCHVPLEGHMVAQGSHPGDWVAHVLSQGPGRSVQGSVQTVSRIGELGDPVLTLRWWQSEMHLRFTFWLFLVRQYRLVTLWGTCSELQPPASHPVLPGPRVSSASSTDDVFNFRKVYRDTTPWHVREHLCTFPVSCHRIVKRLHFKVEM